MNQPPRVPGIRPIFELAELDFERMKSALNSGIVSNNGPMLRQLEVELAGYLKTENVAVVSSGFEALLLALKALAPRRPKVVIPSYTYMATLNSVVQCHLQVVLCDINADSFTMDAMKLEEILSRDSQIGCIVPVNVFGVPADMNAIERLAGRFGVPIAYDNAHGFGTECLGQRTTPGVAVEVFSLHATKTLPAVEGGLVISSEKKTVEEVRRLRNHGISGQRDGIAPGFNSKMDELRAIVGLSSIRGFEAALQRRRTYAARIRDAFLRNGDVFVSQLVPPGVQSNFQNLGILCPAAETLGLCNIMEQFMSSGIGVRSYFDPPMHHVGDFGNGGSFPVTQRVWQQLISFPIHARMSEEDLQFLSSGIDEVSEWIRKRN